MKDVDILICDFALPETLKAEAEKCGARIIAC
jgi:hypothetical protein